MAEKAQKCGMDDVLYKPYALEDLRQILNQYLTEEQLTVAPSEHTEWLNEHTEKEQLEMATVVVQSFAQEVSYLEQNSEKDHSIVHRVKGSAALLGMNKLTSLAKQYEKTQDADKQTVLKRAIISELILIQNTITQWLNERQ